MLGGSADPLSRRKTRALKIAGWLLVCWVVIFWRLGYLPLLDPDEAHYAEITREMSAAQEWIVPLLDGQPHIDKPVLFHWLQAASFTLLGQSEFAARVPSALSALALFFVTFWCGARLFRPDTGEHGALLLATIPATFMLANVGIFDMLFTVCLFGALTSLAVSVREDRPRLQYLAFVFIAGAVLTKGPAAIILLAITAFLCLLHPVTRAATLRVRWATGAILVLALSAPWFLLMWWKFGDRFVDQYIFYNNISLFGAPLYRRSRYPFFYGRVFLTAFLPWSPILIARVADIVRTRTRIRDLAFGEVVLFAWVITIVGFFSASWFKLDTYIYPAAPAVCLLAANAWYEARQPGGERSWVARSLAVIPAVLAAAAAAGAAIMFRLNLPIPGYAVLLPLAIVTGGVALCVQVVRAGWKPPAIGLALIVPLLCAYATLVAGGLPVLNQTRPTPDIAQWLVTSTAKSDPVALYRLSKWKASLRFYAGRPIAVLEQPKELVAFFEANPTGLAVMTEAAAQDARGAGLNLEIVHHRRAVLGTEGRGLRKQRWGDVVVARRPAW